MAVSNQRVRERYGDAVLDFPAVDTKQTQGNATKLV